MNLKTADSLKYWGLVRKYFAFKLKMKLKHLDAILFLNTEGRINSKQMRAACKEIRISVSTIYSLLESGYAMKDRSTYGGRVMYELSPKGKRLCTSIYDMLYCKELMLKYRGMESDAEKLIQFRKEQRLFMNKISDSIPRQQRQTRG